MPVDTTEFANREAVRIVEEALNIQVTLLSADDLRRDLAQARFERAMAEIDKIRDEPW